MQWVSKYMMGAITEVPIKQIGLRDFGHAHHPTATKHSHLIRVCFPFDSSEKRNYIALE